MLFGIGLVFTFNALIALLQIVASQATLQQLTFWMLGSLSGIRWPTLWPLILLAVSLILWSLPRHPDSPLCGSATNGHAASALMSGASVSWSSCASA